MTFQIDLVEFVTKGRFGTFNRDTDRETVLATLGPSDHWVTYPDCYGYGCVGFQIIPDHIPNSDFRLSVGFTFQHAEHFYLPYEHWRKTAVYGWKDMLYNWPDSRFSVELGPFKSGARLDDLYREFLVNAAEVECLNPVADPKTRSFDMPCGVTIEFSKWGSDEFTICRMQTFRRWGPDVRLVTDEVIPEQSDAL
jgi:hypothetical protein